MRKSIFLSLFFLFLFMMVPLSSASMQIKINQFHLGAMMIVIEDRNESEFRYNVVYSSFLTNVTKITDSGHVTLLKGETYTHSVNVFVFGILRVAINMELDDVVLCQTGLFVGPFYIVRSTSSQWRYLE